MASIVVLIGDYVRGCRPGMLPAGASPVSTRVARAYQAPGMDHAITIAAPSRGQNEYHRMIERDRAELLERLRYELSGLLSGHAWRIQNCSRSIDHMVIIVAIVAIALIIRNIRKTPTSYARYYLPLGLLFSGFICLLAYLIIGSKIEPDGRLNEPFGLIPLGNLFLFLGIVITAVVAFLQRRKTPSDPSSPATT